VIDPIAIRIGPLAIHWYGIIIALAVLAGALLASREARRRGEDPERGWSMLLLVIVLAIIGARLYHVVHEWGHYSQNLAEIPQVWRGGLGIPGVIAGGALGVYLYTRQAGLNVARWLDIGAPALLLGQVIGRLGNFVNQELYGPPTTLPWGIPIDAQHRVGEWANVVAYPVDTTRFHPLFGYEALLNIVGVALLLWIGRRFAHRLYDGDIFLLYLVWYGAIRSILEPMRTANWVVGGVPMAMILGIAAVILAGGFFVLRHRQGWGVPGAWLRERSEPPPAQPDGEPASSTPSSEPSAG
jgi:phosphatidylglycerol:prolipoprotein diacylglycerol transferase